MLNMNGAKDLDREIENKKFSYSIWEGQTEGMSHNQEDGFFRVDRCFGRIVLSDWLLRQCADTAFF